MACAYSRATAPEPAMEDDLAWAGAGVCASTWPQQAPRHSSTTNQPQPSPGRPESYQTSTTTSIITFDVVFFGVAALYTPSARHHRRPARRDGETVPALADFATRLTDSTSAQPAQTPRHKVHHHGWPTRRRARPCTGRWPASSSVGTVRPWHAVLPVCP